MRPTHTLSILRHGQRHQDPQWRYTGQREVPLTAVGRQQAKEWAPAFQSWSIAPIWTSPLGRCQETARIIAAALQCPLAVEPALLEIDLGDWEGLTREEMRLRNPGAYEARGKNMATYRPPGGESFADLLERVRPWAEKTLTRAEQTVAVSHAGVVRVLACWARNAPLERLFDFTPPEGTMTIFHADHTGIHLHALGLSVQEFTALGLQ